MASYYYLTASLPMLRFEMTPPMTSAQFLDACRQSLGSNDMVMVEALVSGDIGTVGGSNNWLAQWRAFLRHVRDTLHGQRIANIEGGHEGNKTPGIQDYHIVEAVRTAMQTDNPLEAELVLMRLYWRKADELSQSHVFDVDTLLTYAVQLGILERKALFTPMEGNAEFKRLFSNLQSIIKSI